MVQPEYQDYPACTKVYFASRTHSQLGQFLSELRKVEFDSVAPEKNENLVSCEPVRAITLASRKSLCIHPRISNLPLDQLNEACLELQDAKTPVKLKCEFLAHDSVARAEFRDRALARVRDIEDLVQLGTDLHACPYYAVRDAIPASEIVALPYPLLLNKSARESLGIDLSGNIVIIDEAHNLIDAINGLSSANMSLPHLTTAKTHLLAYLDKFSNKLNGRNKMLITQLLKLIADMISILAETFTDHEVQLTALFRQGTDSVNIHELARYCRTSKLARKVDGFISSSLLAKVNAGRIGDIAQSPTTPVLSLVQRFLDSLTNLSQEGRLFTQTQDNNVKNLCYISFDPSHSFTELVAEARTVVLAGGTMEPISDVLELLFPRQLERVKIFSCGHVIPREHLCGIVLDTGPRKQKFEFTFQKRYDSQVLEDLGQSIINLASVVPDGIVVFFASYEYLEFVLGFWRTNAQYSVFSNKKPAFVESKDTSVDAMLFEYSRSISLGHGGLLFAVIGGKLSEGINFADAMGRAVIVVGVPFPNANTPEWLARSSFIEQRKRLHCAAQGLTLTESLLLGQKAAREHYENVAMRAVNQCIGRVIRHRNDYAMIFLVDVRYRRQGIHSKLPAWIRSSMQMTDDPGFGQILQQTATFFKDKKRVPTNGRSGS